MLSEAEIHMHLHGRAAMTMMKITSGPFLRFENICFYSTVKTQWHWAWNIIELRNDFLLNTQIMINLMFVPLNFPNED